MTKEQIVFFERLPLATIISDFESHQVLYLNTVAQDYFGIAEIPAELTSLDLLKLDEADLRWYQELNSSQRIEHFQPIWGSLGLPYSVVLDCSTIIDNGRTLRVDTINTKDFDDIPDYELYSYTFERSVHRLEEVYKGEMSLDENISDILDLLLHAYAGDRAFIYELDLELGCTVDLYERCRKGFIPYNDKYKPIGTDSIKNLISSTEDGKIYSSITDEMNNPDHYNRMRQGLVVRVMGAKFPARSGMNCFISIDNPRRFWKRSSFLKYTSYLLANDFHVSKIMGHLEASYLLNKTLNNKDENSVKIFMLGGFEIQTSTGILREGSFHSPQICILVSFLLLNRRRMLSIYEISEALWPGQIIDNPYNQIKNVVFRARKSLEGVCQKPLIVANGGTYMINPDLKIWIDSEEFERLCYKAAQAGPPVDQRLNLYHKAFQLYRGSMLPFIEPELWLLTTVNFYQLLYTNMVNEYVRLLSDSGKFTKAFSVASQTIAIEPSNFEIYGILLESLIANHHDELARKYYQQISARLTKKQAENFRNLWKNINGIN